MPPSWKRQAQHVTGVGERPGGGSLETVSKAELVEQVSSVDGPAIATIAGPSPTETVTSGMVTSSTGEGQTGAGGSNSPPAVGAAVEPPGTGVSDGSSTGADEGDGGDADTRPVGWQAATSRSNPIATRPLVTVAARFIASLNHAAGPPALSRLECRAR